MPPHTIPQTDEACGTLHFQRRCMHRIMPARLRHAGVVEGNRLKGWSHSATALVAPRRNSIKMWRPMALIYLHLQF